MHTCYLLSQVLQHLFSYLAFVSVFSAISPHFGFSLSFLLVVCTVVHLCLILFFCLHPLLLVPASSFVP
uniref:Uncharacterized protein n=1 Tax=Arundo donax TaxID=35708 RepID=A0A0A9C049_ARUDO